MWDPENYTLAAHVLPRLLGFIYFFAIGAFIFQIKSLLGKEGILPVSEYLSYFSKYSPKARYYYIPSLFWLSSSDCALLGVVFLGTSISIFLMLGIYPALCLIILFILYLSIVSVGQDFLSFGWESFLLEITFYTFLISLTPIPNTLCWININFLLFRFHVQAGTIKFQSRDPCWRDMTGASFHYESQPLPTAWAWYVHKLPLSLHKMSTFMMFVCECIVPFGLFLTEEIRAFSGILLITLQIAFWLTGNFSYLNHMTAVFCIICFSNHYLAWLNPDIQNHPSSLLSDMFLTVIGTLFFSLQIVRLWQHFHRYRNPLTVWLDRLSPFHLVNRYGLFAIMTKQRIEIIIEGSEDGDVWKEYLLSYKPSEITRRPRRISPYQPRIDWQMWFLPFDDFESATWFQKFLYHLLKGSPEVLKLIRHNPFPEKPPKYIRAVMYDYHFSTRKQKKELGWWWQRQWIGPFSPVMTLQELAN